MNNNLLSGCWESLLKVDKDGLKDKQLIEIYLLNKEAALSIKCDDMEVYFDINKAKNISNKELRKGIDNCIEIYSLEKIDNVFFVIDYKSYSNFLTQFEINDLLDYEYR